MDLFDNAVWGFNARGASDAPLAETITFSDVVGKDIPPVKVRRMYLNVRTKIGLFMLGFVPSHWGLGMSVNSGDGIYDDFGDTFARILFVTKPLGEDSPLLTGVFFNKAVEGAVLQEGSAEILDADTDDLGFVLLYMGNTAKGGAYVTIRSQPFTNSRAFFLSLYSELKRRGLYLAEEVAGLFGSFAPFEDQKININSIGVVARIGYEFRRIFPVFEVGFASPPGDNEFDLDTNRRGNEMKAFQFDANYRPALLLFNFVGGKKFTGLAQKGYTNILESRRVWNAFYSKLSFSLKTDYSVVTPSFVIAWDSKKFAFLGFEPDIEVRNYLLKEKKGDGKEEPDYNIFLSLRAGYLFVGDRLKELERPGEFGTKKSNVFGLVGLIAYEF